MTEIAMHSYRAFGLIFSSELACPELATATGHPDVSVRFAQPFTVQDTSAEAASGYDVRPGHFVLRVPRIGRFIVEEGRSITIVPELGVDDGSLRLFLLGTAVGALLHQRAELPLHGSAVWKDGRSVLLLGASGAGKSSLAAALCRHGWRLQSDDISVVKARNGLATCEAGFPRQKLWPDMLRQLGDDAERYDTIRAGLEKRNVPVESDLFHDAPAVVRGVVALGAYRGKMPLLAPVMGPHRMGLLKRLTFRPNLRTPLNMDLAHFEIIAALARQASVWRLQRPRLDGSPLALAEFLAPQLDAALASPTHDEAAS
ncbi:MAG TPA: hypothetical protein VHB25_13885 [Gemmatimonadaceae bacterium]|nr:hypothetical protein [Gemmatimonadaceae bacterium]